MAQDSGNSESEEAAPTEPVGCQPQETPNQESSEADEKHQNSWSSQTTKCLISCSGVSFLCLLLM